MNQFKMEFLYHNVRLIIMFYLNRSAIDDDIMIRKNVYSKISYLKYLLGFTSDYKNVN